MGVGKSINQNAEMEAIFSSYLGVKTSLQPSMHERYGVLIGRNLELYRSRTEYETKKRTEYLIQIAAVEEWDGKAMLKTYPHAFKFRNLGGKEYFAFTDNRNDQMLWIRYLKAAADPEGKEAKKIRRQQKQKQKLSQQRQQEENIYEKKHKDRKKDKQADRKGNYVSATPSDTTTLSYLTDPNRTRLTGRNYKNYRHNLRKNNLTTRKSSSELLKPPIVPESCFDKERSMKKKRSSKVRKSKKSSNHEDSCPSTVSPPPAPSLSNSLRKDKSICTTQISMEEKYPECIKYFKLLKLGMTTEQVKLRMEAEGFDSRILDNNPNEALHDNEFQTKTTHASQEVGQPSIKKKSKAKLPNKHPPLTTPSRKGLLGDIQKGCTLKHTKTNDRSGPHI